MRMSDIIMALVGGVIGFMSSLGILIAQHLFDKKGRVSIYYKFISQKINQKSWGVYDESLSEIAIIIPAVFEFQNTTNTTRVLRDVHASIYKSNQLVAKLIQIEKTDTRNIMANINTTTETLFGTENSSYSFVLQPRSIQKQKVEFAYKINKNEVAKYDFDSIRISYYDEKDKKISYIAKEKISGWEMGEQTPDIEWIKLSKKVKK